MNACFLYVYYCNYLINEHMKDIQTGYHSETSLQQVHVLASDNALKMTG